MELITHYPNNHIYLKIIEGKIEVERIRNGDLNVDDIAEKPVSFETAPTAYTELRDNPGKHTSLVFSWK